MSDPSPSQIQRNLLQLARMDQLTPWPRGRRTLSDILFGGSVRNVPCIECGRRISYFAWEDGDPDFPLEKGHLLKCGEHPKNKHPEEWKRRRK